MKPSAALLDWYDRHRRDLPWRARPGDRIDPYRVWLSEIMLQQTTVTTVAPYFRRFVSAWPDITSLADAELDDVLGAWAGLGYYARARNLHRCAKTVAQDHGGRFPTNAAALQTLPGIGPYTAAAIAAIAYDEPIAAVDGNVERVVARRFAIETLLPAAKPELRRLAQTLMPRLRAGDFVQALMDLGSLICTPRNPSCALCPWEMDCLARRRDIAGELPRRTEKAPRPTRYGAAFVLENAQGDILLRKRPESGLLGGMMEVPGTAWAARRPKDPLVAAPANAAWSGKGTIEHVFTHFRLLLDVHHARLRRGVTLDGVWVPRAAIATRALPSVMKKVLAAAGITLVRP